MLSHQDHLLARSKGNSNKPNRMEIIPTLAHYVLQLHKYLYISYIALLITRLIYSIIDHASHRSTSLRAMHGMYLIMHVSETTSER